MIVVADFGAAAELSLELEPGAAATVREEIESELSDITVGVSGGAADGLSGSDGADIVGAVLTLDAEVADQTDILNDILNEIESGGVSSSGSADEMAVADPPAPDIGADRGGGGVTGTLAGGGDGVDMTDGGVDIISAELSEQTEVLEDMLDELEMGRNSAGGGLLPPILGGGGGGGGGGSFFGGLAGASLAELLRRGAGLGSKTITKALKRSVGTAVLNIGKGGLQAPGQEREFTGPFSQLQAAAEGINVITQAVSSNGTGTDISTEETNQVIEEAGLELEEPDWVGGLNDILGKSPPEPDWTSELNDILSDSVAEPGWFEQAKEILDGGGDSGGDGGGGDGGGGGGGGGTQPTATSATDDVEINPGANGALQAGTNPGQTREQNQAEQQRINRRGANTNVNVTINADGFGSRTAEDVMEEAKTEAVREIERKITRSGREGL